MLLWTARRSLYVLMRSCAVVLPEVRELNSVFVFQFMFINQLCPSVQFNVHCIESLKACVMGVIWGKRVRVMVLHFLPARLTVNETCRGMTQQLVLRGGIRYRRRNKESFSYQLA